MRGICGLCRKSSEKAPDAAENVAAQEADEKDDGSDWLREYLSDDSVKEKYPCCRSVDVNRDGVPVLLLSTTEEAFISDQDQACMVVFRDGKAEVVKEIGNAGGDKFYCDTGEHTVTWYSRLSGERHIEVYTVKDGNLEKAASADYYAEHR